MSKLDIEFIESIEAPVGLREPGKPGVAPAIGNAIFAATGVRLRHLPTRPAAVLKALSSSGKGH
jgi:CO/xanthine dehydrogenase Mo-binding subunit